MDTNLIAYCGAYCGTCAWRERIGCKGCKANAGEMFWGTCDKASCCISKGLEHCGMCKELPCQKLRDLYEDPEHGDGGTRLANLRNWKEGRMVYEVLDNQSQANAREG